MAVRRLRQAYVVTENIDAAAAFYAEGLGLELQFRDGDRWAQYGAGDVSYALASPEESGGASPGTVVPVFEVDDLDQQVIAATMTGAMIIQSRDMGEHGRMATVKDPTGALIALMQRAE